MRLLNTVLLLAGFVIAMPAQQGVTYKIEHNAKGTYDLRTGMLRLFSPTHGGRVQEPQIVINGLDDPELDKRLGDLADNLRLDLALLEEHETARVCV